MANCHHPGEEKGQISMKYYWASLNVLTTFTFCNAKPIVNINTFFHLYFNELYF